MDSNKLRMQYHGIKWLFELQLVNSPQLINVLKLNMFACSRHIQECEFLIHQEQKAIMVYLQLNWWGRMFYREKLPPICEDILKDLLPSFRFRVVTDKELFDLAVSKAEELLKGAPSEESNTSDANESSANKEPSSELQKTSDLLPDNKELSKIEEELRDETEQLDLSSRPETSD